MAINQENVGKNIALLRKAKGLTQNELGDRLCVSYQAVSKWERGESMPDVGLLVDLANILETSTDNILMGGEKMLKYKRKITMDQIMEGINCLDNMGKLLGKDTLMYRYAIDGINNGMNMDIQENLKNEYEREALVAEAVIQNLMVGAYIDVSDVKRNFKNTHFAEVVLKYAEKYEIK
ncbi:Helix-turn-helix [Hathewaya proteolytica DSM 3090]|uniref:Helix-turn-helix n=1 Tax=Hathewaya proteolytica DSM 3090 TaxID=1121331 RepID=A0A1M6JQT1_9CLOT|nr:helix-turn-helix transcriptional regulator [Hathewaya proteolytica]SHJ49020.1 Helix-turn-helix [Hathewaya proteolytica DSM 3090]